ncbi:MAG: PqiC family protein [Methylococcales bacterium]
MKNRITGFYSISVLALVLNGCLRSDLPIQFYLLSADVVPAGKEVKPLAAASEETVIGLGPVHIPEYLNRPQMVLGVAENQYRLDEDHRWAERLDQNISRALLQSLSAQLGQVQVVRHPWSPRQSIDYQTSIEILELHRDAAGQSRMSAQWTVKSRERTLTAERFDCRLPVPKDDFEALVKAQSECLARLSSDIAGALGQLITENGGSGENRGR